MKLRNNSLNQAIYGCVERAATRLPVEVLLAFRRLHPVEGRPNRTTNLLDRSTEDTPSVICEQILKRFEGLKYVDYFCILSTQHLQYSLVTLLLRDRKST